MADKLARVDELLDDPSVVFAPLHRYSFLRSGVCHRRRWETYLQLPMFLKISGCGLGFESLCREVSDSITWRRFCRIALDGAVPHPTTLMKLNTRCGSVAVAGLNEALLAKAAEAKVLRTNRVRADTTVVPANVCYPTDSGLLAKAIRRIGSAGARIHHAGGAVRTRLRDRSRAAGKRAHGIAAKLRSRSQLGREQVKDGVARITGELADLAAAAARDAQPVLVNARRALRRTQAKAARLAEAGVHDPVAGRRRGRLARAINDLLALLHATAKITSRSGRIGRRARGREVIQSRSSRFALQFRRQDRRSLANHAEYGTSTRITVCVVEPGSDSQYSLAIIRNGKPIG